jgi:hypothetical protein
VYHHFPLGEVRALAFQENGQAVWALDYDNARLVRFDVPRKVVLNAWSLPFAHPVSMDRLGNDLYIAYGAVNAVSRFSIDQAVPANSGFAGAPFAIPLRAGSTYEATFRITALPDRAQLAVAYQDSAWPNDHCVCVVSVSGATIVAPLMVGGNSSGMFMDYEAGRLAVGHTGVSNGPVGVYAVGASSLTPVVPQTATEVFIDTFDLDATGTRLACFCENLSIVPNDPNQMYNIYDLGIAGASFACRGTWATGAYCKRPLFSRDGRFVYIMSRDNQTLMVWRADNGDYGKVRDLSFPDSDHYGLSCLNPDGTMIVGFSYDDYNDTNHRFYVFTAVRD